MGRYITVSNKKLDRYTILQQVLDKRFKQKEEALELGLSIRQIKRLCKSLEENLILLLLPIHAKDLSTTHLLGITLNLCSAFRLATSTSLFRNSFTLLENFLPVYPPSARIFCTEDGFSLCKKNASRAPALSVIFAVVT